MDSWRRRKGKRQINSLMGFLDKGNVRDGLGIRSDNNSSLRAVRAKREADEAGSFASFPFIALLEALIKYPR